MNVFKFFFISQIIENKTCTIHVSIATTEINFTLWGVCKLLPCQLTFDSGELNATCFLQWDPSWLTTTSFPISWPCTEGEVPMTGSITENTLH